MKYECDGRQVEFTDIVTGLSHHIYTYSVKFRGETHDRGYVILASKVFEVHGEEDEDDEAAIFYHLELAESENVYLTSMPYLFPNPEAALEDLVMELVSATGSNEYVSQFMAEVESYNDA